MTQDQSAPTPPVGTGRLLGLFLALAVSTFALYARVGSFAFLNYDDPSYVSENPVVAEGLGERSLEYAFAGEHSTNWHPLTTLSHMLDAELFGVEDAGPHHLVNAGLHALNAGLCFLALFVLGRRLWPAVFAAALFALHPLRVESVAWISERKDVLSGVFFFLTLLAWAHYARKPSVARYVAVALALALGLLAKQMLLTVPFLLVVLDLWPLGRLREGGKSLGGLLLEKLPLVALSAVAVVLMFQAQAGGGTIGSTGALPIVDRVANAFGAVFAYVKLSIAPFGLAAFYPHPSLAFPDDAARLWIPAGLGLVLVLGFRF